MFADEVPVIDLGFETEVKVNKGDDKSCSKEFRVISKDQYENELLCKADPSLQLCRQIKDSDLQIAHNRRKKANMLLWRALYKLQKNASEKVDPTLKTKYLSVFEKLTEKYNLPPFKELNDNSADDDFMGRPLNLPPEKQTAMLKDMQEIYEMPVVQKYTQETLKEAVKLAPELPKLLEFDKVKKIVARHADTMLETLENSTVLDKNDVSIIKGLFKKCIAKTEFSSFEDPKKILAGKFSLDPFANTFNAAVSSTPISTKPFEEILKTSGSHRVNVIVDDWSECKVILSPNVWMDCLEDNALCADTVMHEIAHVFNSCQFLDMAVAANHAFQKSFSSEGDKLFQKQASAAASLGMALADSSACLTQLSAPQNSLSNACAEKKRQLPEMDQIEGVLRSRCNYRSWKFIASQWDEAEADFWGSTGFAAYLKKEHPNIEERKAALRSVIKSWCAIEIEEHGRDLWNATETKILKKQGKTPSIDQTQEFNEDNIPQKYREQAIEESFNIGTKWKIPANQLRKQLSDFKTCAGHLSEDALKSLKPDAEGNIAFGNDSHQSWQKRFDRNALRNSDLRRVLGCTLSEEVPFACSPLGHSESVLTK